MAENSQAQDKTDIKSDLKELIEAVELLGKQAMMCESVTSLELLILRAFDARERVQKSLSKGNLKPQDLIALYQCDSLLYKSCVTASHKHRINLAKWRYIFPNSEELNWWWKIDKSPYRIRDTVAYEEPVPWIIIISFLIAAVSACIVVITTQRLWQNGLSLVGGVNLVLQVLVGAGLVTEKGRHIATRLGLASMRFAHSTLTIALNPFIRLHQRFFRRSMEGSPKLADYDFPLGYERLQSRGYSYFFASCVFLFLSILIPFAVMPAVSRISHEIGINAYNQRNLSGSRFYLEMAVNLQPETPTLIRTNLAASLYQLGALYIEIGDLDAAVKYLEQAIREDNQLVFSYEPLIRLYSQMRKFDEALSLADRGINLLRLQTDNDFNRKFSTSGDREKILYLLLVARANVYLLKDIPEVALLDLQAADQIVKQTSKASIFITSKNKDFPPANAVKTTELYALRALTYRQLYAKSCNANLLKDIQSDWAEVRLTIGEPLHSEQRIWLVEARRETQCDSAKQ